MLSSQSPCFFVTRGSNFRATRAVPFLAHVSVSICSSEQALFLSNIARSKHAT